MKYSTIIKCIIKKNFNAIYVLQFQKPLMPCHLYLITNLFLILAKTNNKIV